jgi:hypothetical protein
MGPDASGTARIDLKVQIGATLLTIKELFYVQKFGTVLNENPTSHLCTTRTG